MLVLLAVIVVAAGAGPVAAEPARERRTAAATAHSARLIATVVGLRRPGAGNRGRCQGALDSPDRREREPLGDPAEQPLRILAGGDAERSQTSLCAASAPAAGRCTGFATGPFNEFAHDAHSLPLQTAGRVGARGPRAAGRVSGRDRAGLSEGAPGGAGRWQRVRSRVSSCGRRTPRSTGTGRCLR